MFLIRFCNIKSLYYTCTPPCDGIERKEAALIGGFFVLYHNRDKVGIMSLSLQV